MNEWFERIQIAVDLIETSCLELVEGQECSEECPFNPYCKLIIKGANDPFMFPANWELLDKEE